MFLVIYPAAMLLWLATVPAMGQQAPEATASPRLTIPMIMQDPDRWIGSLPHDIHWSDDGKWVYFLWNPDNAEEDSLYVVSRKGGIPRKVSPEERKQLPSFQGVWSRDYTRKVYEKDGDIFLLHIRKGAVRQITRTTERESDPAFTHDEQGITFRRGDNLYLWNEADGSIVQLTDFRKGRRPPEQQEPKTEHEKWLKRQERRLIRVLRERLEKQELARKRAKATKPDYPREIYLEDQQVEEIRLSPDRRFITFRLEKDAPDARRTRVPNYITETGFTEELTARPKVGSPQPTFRFGIYDTEKDTVYDVDIRDIPGIYDSPEFRKAYAPAEEDSADSGKHPSSRDTTRTPRNVILYGPFWSENGEHALMVARAWDNKDRWLLLLDPATGKLTPLDRQHDEAWVGGPGISGWNFFPGNVGWMPDNRRVWFHSEASGYSHLYTVDIVTGEKRALTSGKFEVHQAWLSRSKRHWYLITNEAHPGERHLYRMPLNGGRRTRITTRPGNHQVYLSPDEKVIAVRYSYTNKPWQLYLMANQPGAAMRQITDDLKPEFKAYPWRDPEIVTFTARDGATVYARLYRPEEPQPQGPAVIFVHGAGYLQNAHRWWSSYFREYMFHNFLVDQGYTVLDIDYRGSAGYGRDWRTAIYRHMGGKDLSDQVDGARFLVERYNIDPRRIGIYGGSYGGFITFMAMFTEPGVFACGAALRPVTDWSHYNHPYTSNILNEPQLDSLAYVRSSPIYYAEGLQGGLLICHGMIDTNVHFQDVVRLVQRLIELGKENWEVAIYPLEGHGFKEPGSWTDEYRRVYKLFQEYLE
ncbi:MAG: S9 family peptidase [Calditrichaeota bacterium]|nr:MAG: S9 family peptidase [Calditrichota bacterium]